jgi:hypothetical protein
MTIWEYVVIGAILVLVLLTLVWVYLKRNRLFFNSHFTAETTMMNYQDAHRLKAMEQVAYMKEEKEEDEAGEKDKDE